MVRTSILNFFGSNTDKIYFIGTYGDRISYNGYVLSDHMLLGTVVATILILDNTAQVSTAYEHRGICQLI